MDAVLYFDHRFYRDADGVAFSVAGYNYGLLSDRYLAVFDNLTIIGRLSDTPPRARGGDAVEGPGIRLVALQDWTGLLGLVRCWRRVAATLSRATRDADALIMIVPSMLSLVALPRLLARPRPYALEVVGDPAGVFATGASQHPLRRVSRRLWPAVLRVLCARAAAIAYVTAEALQLQYPAPPGAFTAEYSSIDLTARAFVSAPRTSHSQARRLLSIGSMAQPYKGFDTLLDALQLGRSSGLDFTLRIVGEGQLKTPLIQKAESMGLGEHVVFVGRLKPGDEVRAECDAADLFVLASRTEGLPRSMIEAMARGLPCVGTRVGGIPELLPDSMMVPAGDALALATLLSSLASDPIKLNEASRHGLVVAQRYHAGFLRARRHGLYAYLADVTERHLAGLSGSVAAHAAGWSSPGRRLRRRRREGRQ